MPLSNFFEFLCLRHFMYAGDCPDDSCRNTVLAGKPWPLANGIFDFVKNLFVTALPEPRKFCHGLEIVQCKAVTLAVEGHLVRPGPCPLRVVGIGHVESWGEGPCSLLVHQEPDVLGVIVLVAGANVEGCPAVHFF